MLKETMMTAAALCAVSGAVFAGSPYVGAQVGGIWSAYDLDPFAGIVFSKMDDQGYSAHVNAGWAFNKNFGLEVGEQIMPKYTFVSTYKDYSARMSFRVNYVDLSLKATANFGNFGLFIKPGMAWAHKTKSTVTIPDHGSYVVSKASNAYVPVVGAGMMYYFTPNFAADLSSSFYFKKKDIEASLFGGVGIAYYFN